MRLTKLPDETREEIVRVVKERIGAKAVEVRMTMGYDHLDEESLFVSVYCDGESMTRDDHRKFYGINSLVRKVMGEEMDHIFPYVGYADAKDLEHAS